MIAKLKSTLGYKWHLYQRENLHWRVETGDGKLGFCAYGDEEIISHFRRNFLDADQPVVVKRGWHGPKLAKHVGEMVQRFGIVIADKNLHFPANRYFEVLWPARIKSKIFLPEKWVDFCAGLSKSARNDLWRFRKLELRCVVSRDRARLAEFHRAYFIPSMIASHGGDARSKDFRFIAGLFDRGGELVEIWRGDEWVGGYVGQRLGNDYHFRILGWRGGEVTLRQDGIVAAMYIFAIQRAIEGGVSRFHAGGSSPYLENGLLVFKSKWGAQLEMLGSEIPSWRVLIDPKNPAVKRFFSNHSLLVRNHELGCFDVISDRDPAEVNVRPGISAGIGAWRNLDSLSVTSPQ